MNIANFFQKNRMIAKVEKVQKSKQRSLNLEDFDLTEFPNIILNCDSIRSLILQRNKISELPKEVGIHLRGLKYLSIQFNNFQSFPECLKHLTALVSLNISHNPINSLINDINCFKDLKYLWCNSCGITSLPKSLGSLAKLDTFGARNNNITTLPDTLVQLKELRWLSLEGNNLHVLPNDFDKLVNLHHLNLNKNCFTSIPDVLPKMSSLMYLHLQRNLLRTLDKEIVDALSNVKISLMHNPLDNGHVFKEYKHLMLNPEDYDVDFIEGADLTTDSSDWDSDWENSTDTMYLNYDSSSESSESDYDEIPMKIPRLSRFFVGQ